MKSASAMKYRGELVDAVDCDYDSFKELVPLCPNCKEPVFLRIGGQRESVKGKAYQIGPHWCHFKGISKEQVASCESRVNGYSEKDKQRIASQARGQRLKLLQRWFAKILQSNPFLNSAFECEEVLITLGKKHLLDLWVSEILLVLNQDTLYIEKYIMSRNALQIKQAFLDAGKKESQAKRARSIYRSLSEDKRKEISEKAFVDLHGQNFRQSTVDYVRNVFSSEIQFELNKKILCEVISFLRSQKGRPILAALAADAMSCVTPNSFHAQGLSKTIVDQLITIPWASEFQRLEAEAKQHRGAA
jgi:hypothetical protein